jgi:acyl-CoA thioesterase-1
LIEDTDMADRLHQCVPTLLALLVGLLMGVPARGEDRPAPIAEQLPGLGLLKGPWAGGPIHRESVLFVQGKEGLPSAKLLFDAKRILAVHRADGTQSFEARRDYEVTADGSGLVLPTGSRVYFHKESDFYLPKGAPNSLPHLVGHPETYLLFAQGHVWHDWQVEISYEPKDATWTGYRPTFAGDRLPKTLAKLKARQPLTIAVSGDSISEGYNASGFTKGAPFMPAYPGLVAAQLEQTYGSKVTMHNHAIAGWSSAQGVKDLDNLLKRRPDLVIIAYGMNDVGGRNPEAYKANIATMIRRIKAEAPATEIVLVSTMLGNSEWVHTPPEMFPRYRDALASLQADGVVMTDVTAIWETLSKRKRHFDLTGNGVNHPNDYGHRVYAQAILALLVEPLRIR